MDTNPSTSVSQDTLANRLGAMGVQSTTSINLIGPDTPLPRENISAESLKLLDSAATKLSNPNIGIKRFNQKNHWLDSEDYQIYEAY